MPWFLINDGGSGYGVGIHVILKNGNIEEFLDFGKIKFMGQQWQAEYLADKSQGELQIGFFNSENGGQWEKTAFFPSGSFQFVRAILKDQSTSPASTKSSSGKRVRCLYDHVLPENKLDDHNREIHDLVICDQCEYQCAGTLMLKHHVYLEH